MSKLNSLSICTSKNIIFKNFKKSTPKSKIFENKLEEISQMQNLLADFAQEEKRPVGRPKKKTAQED